MIRNDSLTAMNHRESYLFIWHLILSYQSSDLNPRRRHDSTSLTGASRNIWETLAEHVPSRKDRLKRKKRKIWSCVGKTSRLTWRYDRYVIHTRLTTPVQSTIAARSDSVTSWTKEKGNVRKFNHHRHHRHHYYSRKDVFPQEREASARGWILCGKQ